FENFISSLQQLGRHTREFGNVDTKAMFAAPGYQLAKKDHPIIYLFYRHIEIFDPWKGGCQFVQFVVMRGKQRFGPRGWVVMKKFSDGPGDGYAIVRTRAAPDLVQQDQAPLGEVVHDACR